MSKTTMVPETAGGWPVRAWVASAFLLAGVLLPVAGAQEKAGEQKAGQQKAGQQKAGQQKAGQQKAAQEKVYVRRLADTVAVRLGPLKLERVLYAFRATELLSQGDEIEQGSSGHTEILLSGGGFVSMRSSAHVLLRRLDAAGDVLDFRTAKLLAIRAGERPLRVALPGGVHCLLDGTEIKVTVEQGRMIVRNEGRKPVLVVGDLVLGREASGAPGGAAEGASGAAEGASGAAEGASAGPGIGSLTLDVGEEVRWPYLVHLAGAAPRGSVVQLWAQRVVRHQGGVEARVDGGRLLLRAAPGDGQDSDPEAAPEPMASVGGVTARVVGDDVLVLRDHRPRPAGVTAPQMTNEGTTGTGTTDTGTTMENDR